jgi:hypothetical protein
VVKRWDDGERGMPAAGMQYVPVVLENEIRVLVSEHDTIYVKEMRRKCNTHSVNYTSRSD